MTFDQLDTRVSGDLAVGFGFLHMSGRRTDGSVTDVWARLTVGLERRSGEWRIVHEHQSFPTRMDGSGKSATDLKP
jgi:ketosteroid isomerase-like protein